MTTDQTTMTPARRPRRGEPAYDYEEDAVRLGRQCARLRSRIHELEREAEELRAHLTSTHQVLDDHSAECEHEGPCSWRAADDGDSLAELADEHV